jgi:hypothetical protein
MKPTRSDFTSHEWKIIQSHRTPLEVQRFLREMPYNRERNGTTCLSFREAIRQNQAHCLEAAMIAAVVLEQHDYPPLLVSIESQDKLDHVLFLYKENGRYGSVARSRDTGLHGRKALFKSVRDLVLSYIDAYVDKTGRITGYGWTSLTELGNYNWRFSARNVWFVERHLQHIPHRAIRTSDARYHRWHRRYLEFQKHHPGVSPAYYPNTSQWLDWPSKLSKNNEHR